MKQIVCSMIFGSHLYGTDTPTSDRDFKGIFLPAKDEILLQRVPRSITSKTKAGEDRKNTPQDEDHELYSLDYFLKLALKGETVAIDMLHAPTSAMRSFGSLWRHLRDERTRFYTKNLFSLVGYARRQAAKYGVKGSRLADAKRALAWLQSLPAGDRLRKYWALRPQGDHLLEWTQVHEEASAKHNVPCWDVCGRKLQDTVTAGYAVGVVAHFVEAYGARAKQAKDNAGIDWKAVSHALRAGYQVRAILKDGGFTYPLPEVGFLRDVKSGARDYTTIVAPALDALLDECEALSKASDLPAQANTQYWDTWLMDIYGNVVKDTIWWQTDSATWSSDEYR